MRSTAAVNARLLWVAGAAAASNTGTSGDGFEGEDPPAAEPAPGEGKWSGDVGVYLEEVRDRRPGAGGSEQGANTYVRRDLSVSVDLRVAWQEGDVLQLRRLANGVEIRAIVQMVDLPDPEPGMTGEVRLTLEPA